MPPNIPLRRPLALLCSGLVLAQCAAWGAALWLFAGQPVLLGAALLAYGLGLRHAFDADHIAAIDNVVRAAVHAGRQPLATGLWFSLGHSSVVLVACIGAAWAAQAFALQVQAIAHVGERVAPLLSSAVLLVVAAMNAAVFVSLWRRRPGADGAGSDDATWLPAGRIARWLQPVLRRADRGWLLAGVGVLLGLGFDTASEIALLALSAAQAAHGLPVWAILVFPLLFTAAMTLADTGDGLLMLGGVRWAAQDPSRRRGYSLGVTALSVAVAVAVSGWQLAGWLALRTGQAGLAPPGWSDVPSAWIGGLVTLLFTALWAVARWRGQRSGPRRPAPRRRSRARAAAP